jgi:type VI secretion system secreted protein Hcp
MAVDIFALFSSSAGKTQLISETTDKDYAQRQGVTVVEVQEVSFGVENQTTIGSATSGAGAGKAKFKTLTIKRAVGPASAGFFSIATSGGRFDQVQIDFRKAGATTGATGKPYLSYTFKMVFVTSIDIESGDEGPIETLSLAYGAMQVQYWQQEKTGALSANPQTAMWNQVTNTASMDIK